MTAIVSQCTVLRICTFIATTLPGIFSLITAAIPAKADCLPSPVGAVAWWQLDGNAQDALGNNPGTIVGTATFPAGEVDQALSFDGTSNEVDIPAAPSLNVGTGNGFTLELWINPNNTSSQMPLVEYNNRHDYLGLHFWISVGAQGTLYANLIDTSGTAHQLTSPSGIVLPGVWQHLALTYSRTNGTVIFYRNGTNVYQQNVGALVVETSLELFLGRRVSVSGSQYRFKGSLDEVTLYNRALSQSELQAIVSAGTAGKCKTAQGPNIAAQPQNRSVIVGGSAGFSILAFGTPPLYYQWQLGGSDLSGETNVSLNLAGVQPSQAGDYRVIVSNLVDYVVSSNATLTVLPPPPCVPPPPGLVSWFQLEGNASDKASSGSGVILGNPVYTNGLVGQALFFDGSGDGLMAGSGNSLNVGTNDGFTVEMWINLPDVSHRNPIFEWEDGSSFAGPLLFTGVNGAGTFQANIVGVGNTVHVIQNTSNSISPNVWHHLAFTYSRSSGNGRIYLDGSVLLTQNIGSFTPRTTGSLYIGRRNLTGAQETCLGTIDEPCIYGRELSGSDVQSLFSAGSAGKCTSPVGPTIVSQPQNQNVLVGSPVTFTLGVVGTPPLYYQWQFGGSDLPGETNASLNLTGVQPSQAGDYRVIVSNSVDLAISSNATLTVLPPPPCAPPSPGLVSWFQLEGNASDKSSSGSGVILGNPVYTNGLVGQALFFDGSGDGLMAGSGNSLNVGTNDGFTVEMWINLPDVSRRNPLFEWEDGSSFAGPLLFSGVAGPASLQANIVGVGNVIHVMQTASALFGANSWHHIAFSYSQISGKGRIYIDGAIAQEQNLGVFTPRTTGNLFLGRRSIPGQEETMLGAIDEPSVYNRELSQNEIQAIFSATISGKCGGPVPPFIVSQPQGLSVIEGQTPSFGVVAGGTAPLSYQWSLGGIQIDGATNSALVLTNVKVAQAGIYTVTIANDFGLAVSSNALLSVSQPPPSATYDLMRDFSIANNPAGVWSYGAAPKLTGPFSLLTVPVIQTADNGAIFQSWQRGRYEQPTVGRNSSSFTATNQGGQGVFPPGTVWFDTGSDGSPLNFADIRFTVPSGGAASYLLQASVRPKFDGPVAGDTDFHVVQNGVEIFGKFLGPTDTTTYTNVLTLADGDTIDFLLGRGADGVEYGSALKIQVTLNLINSTPTAPSILIQPLDQTAIVGSRATFTVVANGTAPLAYQWEFQGTNLPGATNSTLILNSVAPDHAGVYSVVVSNNINFITSSNALLVVNPAPPCVPAVTGTAAWWPLDGNLADNIAGNNGFLIGDPAYTNGLVGQALFFAGSGEGMMAGSANSLNVGTNDGFTVEMWINLPDVSHRNPLFEWEDGSSFAGPLLFTGVTGPAALQANIVGVGNIIHVMQTASGLFGANSWHHIAFSYSRASGKGRVYVDGAVAQEQNLGVFTPRTTGNLFLGRRSIPGQEETMLGAMDEPSVYNRELSPNEVQALFNAGASGKCNTPLAPSIVSQPQNHSVVVGNNVVFSVSAAGSQPLSYQWMLDGVNLAGATSPSLSLQNVQHSQAGGYSVIVANALGSATSDTATLTVNDPPPGPPSIVSISASQTVLAGQNASFTVVAIGTGTLSYQWRLNHTNMVGATNATLSFTPAQVSNSGNYDVVVSDSAGSATSPAVTLTVTSTTQGPVITSQPGSRIVSVGDGTAFAAGVSGTGPITYQWYFNGSIITGAVASTLTFTNVQASQAGTYWIVANNPYGTAQSAGAILDVTGVSGAMIFVSLAGAHVYDVDGVTRLPAGTTFLAQLYAGPDSSSLLPIGAAVPFNSPGHFLAFERTIPTATPGQVVAVQFRVWESAYGPSYEAALAAGGKTGTSLILQAGTQAGGNPPPPPPELTGVQDFSLVPGQVASGPQITAQPVGQSVLLGAATSLSVSASGPGLLHYQWYLNGNPVAAATGPALTVQAAHLSDGGDYVAVVSNTSGSVTSQVATITVVVQRVVEVVGPPTLPAGSLITVPLQLTSLGDVGGMTFVLHYDPDYLSTPEVAWDSSLDGGLKDINVPALGQLRGVFALPGTAVPAGTQVLAVVSFHTRSVLVDSTTALNLQVVDISQPDGTGIQFGTEVLSCNVGIVATGLSGDANGNGMLDIGDATLLLRMLDQQDTIRSWDVTQNDLNQNGQLDSGDVIKIMRVAAGIDPQPGGGSPHAVAKAASPKSPAVLSELALLDPLILKATNGSLVTVQVRLANIGSTISGASFTLNYPVAALRLLNSQAVATGPIVPGGAVAVWNVSPSQNNYATQNGHVTLAVSSGSAWAARDGVLATLTFQVQPGATNQYIWPLITTGVQVTANGYNRSLFPGAGTFIGRSQLPGLLSGLGPNLSNHFQFTITGDPGAGYIVDVSSNMVDWTPLTNVTSSAGSVQLIDPQSAQFPRRFYRTRPAP